MQLDPALHEHLPHPAQQSRPIPGHQFHHRPIVGGLLAEGHQSRHLESALNPRDVPAGQRRREIRAVQGVRQTRSDFLDARALADGGAGILQHCEAVESVAAVAGDDPGIENVQPQLIEDGGDQREQVVLIAGVNEDFGAAPLRIVAGHDQRPVVVAFFENRPGMPGNLVGGVAQEIIIAEALPHPIDAFLVDAGGVQPAPRLRLNLANALFLVDRVVQPPAQRLARRAVELPQQRGSPSVPQLGIGAADIGDRQQVQIVQMHLVAHPAGEGMNDLGIVDIFLLRGQRQRQVMAHQPGHQSRVEAAEPVPTAEAFGILGTQFGMISTATLGDIVVQAGDIEQFRFGQPIHDGVAMRQYLGELRQIEPPQVAHHE